jgi:hypothetical protein
MDTTQGNDKMAVIKDRCAIIAEIINKIKDTYLNSNENQKAFIQTIIGAAIFYIPKPQNYWSGYISAEAIKGFRDIKRFIPSQEHNTPRKDAAKELLEMNKGLTTDIVEEKYTEKYCKLHYLTLKENKIVIKHQKKCNGNYEKAYNEAGIKLILINKNILKQLRERNIEVIEELLSSNNCT